MDEVNHLAAIGVDFGAPTPNQVQVEETTGSAQEKTGKTQTIGFKNCIIAAGSQAVRLPFMPEVPRVVDSTGALELKEVPKRMLILAAASSAWKWGRS